MPWIFPLVEQRDYWRKATIDQFQTLSIGTAVTSEMAFMTMFNERGVIDGGPHLEDR